MLAKSELQIPAASSPPHLFPISFYLALPTSIYKTSSKSIPLLVASYLVAKPLWWALEQLGVTGEDGILGSGQLSTSTSWYGDYVVLALVERAAENVISQRRKVTGGAGPGECLFSLDGFRKSFAFCVGSGPVMSDMDAKVLLKYLERDKGVLVVEKNVSGETSHLTRL